MQNRCFFPHLALLVYVIAKAVLSSNQLQKNGTTDKRGCYSGLSMPLGTGLASAVPIGAGHASTMPLPDGGIGRRKNWLKMISYTI